MNGRKSALTVFLLGACLVSPAWAGNKMINVQGKLTDAGGNPLSNPTVIFRLYTVPTGGSAAWTNTLAVTTSNGLFNVPLQGGSPSLDSLPFNVPYYLGMQVTGDSNELQPRQLLGASAYALGSLGNFDVQNSLQTSSLTVTSSATVQNLSVNNLNVLGAQTGITLGKLKQVVYATETIGGSTASTAFVNIGAQVSMTPSSASSTIYIFITAQCDSSPSGNVFLGVSGTASGDLATVTNTPARCSGSAPTTVTSFFKDSPGTTNPQTYHMRVASDVTYHTAYVGNAAATGAPTSILVVETQ